MSETANVVYGRLLEAAHFTGYGVERMAGGLEWLLDDGRWRTVGAGFDDVREFMASVTTYDIPLEQRKSIGRKLKREHDLSLRDAAKAAGIGTMTLHYDINGRTPVYEEAPESPETRDEPAADRTQVYTPPAWLDAPPAKVGVYGRAERDAQLAEQRARSEAEARKTIAQLGPASHRIELADITTWRPTGVSCIVTDPPYITSDAVELHSALADFALDVLPTHGALVVMTWQPILAAVLDAMRRDRLVYRWAAAWTFETPQRTPDRARRVFDGWKPVLVFHKDGWTDETTYLYDVVRSADADKASHVWGQGIDGFRQLVRAASQAGDTVCDPFVGGGTTAVAALAEARLFIGCDCDAEAVRVANERLAA